MESHLSKIIFSHYLGYIPAIELQNNSKIVATLQKLNITPRWMRGLTKFMAPQCRKLLPTTGWLSRTIFILFTNHNPAAPQKDRPQMMGGVKRRKKTLNDKEAAPPPPRCLAAQSSGGKQLLCNSVGAGGDQHLPHNTYPLPLSKQPWFFAYFFIKEKVREKNSLRLIQW